MKKLNGIDLAIFINLDRRKDRHFHMLRNINFHIERFAAKDASELMLDNKILRLFGNVLNKLNKAEISCALSHYSIWKELADHPSAENCLILEDDVCFNDGFVQDWNNNYSNKIPSEWNILYLGGCQPWNFPKYNQVLESYNECFSRVSENNFFTQGNHYWHMNTQSYLISKIFARKIVDEVESRGFSSAVDHFLINFCNSLDPKKLYHITPLQSHQIHEENENPEIDKNSDIRNSKDFFDILPSLNMKCKDSSVKKSLINPSVIFKEDVCYKLFQVEEYNEPPPSGFQSSQLTYELHKFQGERELDKKTCIFNLLKLKKNRCYYKAIREELGDNPMLVDVRFMDNSFFEKKGDIFTLATATLIPWTKKHKRSAGNIIEIGHFKSVLCSVNLNNGHINYESMFSANNQRGIQKNWSACCHKDWYYLIYSCKPFAFASSDISFQDISLDESFYDIKLGAHNSTNPIHIGGDTYCMLSHSKNNHGEGHSYSYSKVSFDLCEGDITNISFKNIDLPKDGLYCSSITKSEDGIDVHCGERDLSNFSFSVNNKQNNISRNSDINYLQEKEFPYLAKLNLKGIPRKIHVSWKNKNVISSGYSMIEKGIKRLCEINPSWDLEIYDDEDVNRLIRDSVGIENWELVKNKKMTEKTDLWRLLKTYKEGGLYVDIDKYFDVDISEILKPSTLCVIPTFQDIDFSQDIILTAANNPIIGEAIVNNLEFRRQGKSLFFNAVYSYMYAVSRKLTGKRIKRNGQNQEYFNQIRSKIRRSSIIETYRESGPADHILFRNKDGDFSEDKFISDKAELYDLDKVVHWNSDTRKEFEESKNTIHLKTYNNESLPSIGITKKNKFILDYFKKIKNKWEEYVDDEFIEFAYENIRDQIHLSDSEKKDFSVFNPGRDIAIVTLYTPEVCDFSIFSERSLRMYCEKNNYTLYVYRKKIVDNCSANWSKANAILNHYDDHKDIMWLDSDTIVLNMDKKIEDILYRCTPLKRILACEDVGKKSILNSGAIIFRKHSYVKRIIKKWSEFNGDKSSLYASGGDQEVLCSILKKSDSPGFNRKIFPMNEFNTDPRLIDDNTFIVHFMAYPRKLKYLFMMFYAKKMGLC
jgi:GR25 family glycosyltransferase involved in LPS biosynthesis